MQNKTTETNCTHSPKLGSYSLVSKAISETISSSQLLIPLISTQICDVAVQAIDVVMMGLLGTQSIASGALGTVAFATAVYVGYGIVSGVGAMAAEAVGTDEPEQVSYILFQGLWLLIIISLPMVLLLWCGGSFSGLIGQDKGDFFLVKSYANAVIWGLPAAIGLLIAKDIASAVNYPQSIAVIAVIGLGLNIPVNYILMFGKFGFPDLGLSGIGWASSFIYWLTFLIAIVLFMFHPKFDKYSFFGNFYQLDPRLIIKLFRIGYPMGIHYGTEIALLNITTLLMGSFGTATLAAHQITIQTVEVFMAIPSAIACTTVARVGYAYGAKDAMGIRVSAFINLAIGAFFSLLVIIIVWEFPKQVVSIFINPDDPNYFNTKATAISFLYIAGFYQFAYGLQMNMTGALLGIQDTKIPMLINLLSFWGSGLGVGYLLAMPLGYGGMGLWWGLVLGPLISSLLLVYRFLFLNRQKGDQIKDVNPAVK
ncbi:MAG: MATE family efflux transporter [Moorea sp. SIO1F2]|uniref:MATE family efflux transporter n=1 Tax=unclassified Moorena TaxID=2683338 RepID=UPI0013BE291C|nr:MULTISPECIES: MATE family efflux transporter [unclassified Moorena]NEN97238.1 MATE family efflux transporter [Moorena sp. SIO3I7]NEO10277.1 MATE family efflux transporter [Moorena sp. SIO3I8]NEO24140.1 MATE family efflux transporter [Moorena sp. SIO4A5]NEP26665.1 MATE family efflux transporter [Moorena sp. SIO3I6]NEQ62109.1 MATE family efflux transporter [Moorena sp. SIO4A1]